MIEREQNMGTNREEKESDRKNDLGGRADGEHEMRVRDTEIGEGKGPLCLERVDGLSVKHYCD